MNDPADLVNWISVRRRTRSFKAASLIHGDVNDHGALAHRTQYFTAAPLRRARSGHKYRADDHVCRKHLLLDAVLGRGPGTDGSFEQFIELAEPDQRSMMAISAPTPRPCVSHAYRQRLLRSSQNGPAGHQERRRSTPRPPVYRFSAVPAASIASLPAQAAKGHRKRQSRFPRRLAVRPDCSRPSACPESGAQYAET